MNNLSKKKWELIKVFIKKNKFSVTCSILCGVISNIFTVLIPVSIGKYFDFLFGSHSHRAKLIAPYLSYFWSNMDKYILFLIAIIFLRMIFQYTHRLQMMILGEKFVKDLREKLFRKQLEIPTVVYDKLGTGKYLLRHSGDLKSIKNYLTIGIIKFLTNVFLLVFTLYFLFLINKSTFIIILLGGIFTTLLLFVLNKILYKVSIKRRNTRSGLLSFVNRQLQATNTIKAFNKTVTEVKKYDKRSSKLFNLGIQFQKIFNLIYVTVPALVYLILVTILYFIYWAKQQGDILFDPGTMFGFVLLFITILPTLRRTIKVGSTWKLGNISFNKLLKVFELSKNMNSNNLQTFIYKQGKIEFKSVDFSYTENRFIFKNLDFTIQPKCINQIRLKNGSGKSTLIKLIAGLYFPNKGTIEYDGQKIENIKLKSLRKKITFISNEFLLLGNTVFEAVSYSRNENKKLKAQKILDKFQRNIDVQSRLYLSDKVTEGGKNLSKSQIKMLQYVRAILSGKPVIIIDEPLRDLDSNVKRNILQYLKAKSKNKTLVFICNSWREPSLPIDNIIDLEYNKMKDEIQIVKIKS